MRLETRAALTTVILEHCVCYHHFTFKLFYSNLFNLNLFASDADATERQAERYLFL